MELSNLIVKLDKLKDISVENALLKSASLVAGKAQATLNSSGRDPEGKIDIFYHLEDNSAVVEATGEEAWWAELGTGSFAENGDGRPGWWVWVDPECGAPKSQMRIIRTYEEAVDCATSLSRLYGASHVHVSNGQPATRFMRNALEDSKTEILEIFKEGLK